MAWLITGERDHSPTSFLATSGSMDFCFGMRGIFAKTCANSSCKHACQMGTDPTSKSRQASLCQDHACIVTTQFPGASTSTKQVGHGSSSTASTSRICAFAMMPCANELAAALSAITLQTCSSYCTYTTILHYYRGKAHVVEVLG